MATAKTLTTKALMKAFNVSHMTVLSWRNGAAGREKLATVDTGTRNVAFAPADVKRYAKAHGIEIVDANALVPGAVAEAKAGPKPAAKKVPVKKSALRIKARGKPAAKTARTAA